MIGIYFIVSAPVVKGGERLFTIQKFQSYSHNIESFGGFWDASLELAVSQQQAENWYKNGLGRQIHVKNHLGGTVWRGFVNSIAITAGSQVSTIGPLIEIVNRATATYTPRDFSTYPPIDGTTTITLLSNDTISQQEYGIFEQSVAAGSTTEETAEKIRDTFIEQYKLPKTTGDFSINGVGQPLSMSLSLLGNIHWLKVYPYNNLTPLTYTAYDKIIQILNANTTINPGVFSTDYSYIDDNNFIMYQLEDRNRPAWDLLSDVLVIGNDTTDDRRILGMYEDDKIKYSVIPSVLEYLYSIASQHQRIIDYNSNAMIFPWDIRPGKWIKVNDWLIGSIAPTTLREDPRNKFIERVNFSTPYTVGLTGSPYDSLSQMLSKITYTGGIY